MTISTNLISVRPRTPLWNRPGALRLAKSPTPCFLLLVSCFLAAWLAAPTAYGQCDSSFTAGTYYSAGANPTSAAVADFNGDGKPDLAVANDNSHNISVLLGNGNGSFGAVVNYNV